MVSVGEGPAVHRRLFLREGLCPPHVMGIEGKTLVRTGTRVLGAPLKLAHSAGCHVEVMLAVTSMGAQAVAANPPDP